MTSACARFCFLLPLTGRRAVQGHDQGPQAQAPQSGRQHV
eukprot:CAMPEP_0177176968 /NCGR_PEP_ID=MMETSP0367-20130122/13543_1 /TAXON_ID=447022 ORGANISM="Scrippsiella hangoei-like, Strain SHHI-4" /NCGR_SAMPLE_ID=MMETSP0367 /ASSEMBLY_ACC=CAM_ASM_000362 /LENGTH=39 /DNA_ID= /DNA_START= /DNA_END= /DNA_ORIENTATION=